MVFTEEPREWDTPEDGIEVQRAIYASLDERTARFLA
jgi:hypothetical protein